MDYTDTPTVIQSLKSNFAENVNPDAISGYLPRLVTSISRDVDHYCTGVGADDAASDDYFQQADVAGEILQAALDNHGELSCWPHKPRIRSVAAMAWRANALDTWHTLDVTGVRILGPRVKLTSNAGITPGSPISGLVRAQWAGAATAGQPGQVEVQISYNGGLGTDMAGLPGDFVVAVTDLVVRVYREERAGISDAIGVAEMGLLIYNKEIPVRISRQLRPYMRQAPWFDIGY